MHITEIEIKNFKAFDHIKINCNNAFNFIVGENNIGKSTIFEALNLWKFAYDNLIQERNKNAFYKATTNYYIPFSNLNLIRLVDDNDILNNASENFAIISLTINDGPETFKLSIKFEKPGIKNSYIRIFNDEDFSQFQKFANHIKENKSCKLKNAIFIYQTRPVSTIPRDEPFYNNGQIEQKIKIGKSHDVLRNKILKTENTQAPNHEKFLNLENRIKNIIGEKYSIKFKNKNRIDDEYVRITLKSQNQKELEVSLMGSGFLQIIEIFSTIEYIERNTDGLSLILIDEPDSHIHSDLQVKLIDELKTCTNNQVFIITHNDRLTSKATNGELFYINKIVKQQKTLNSLPIEHYHKVKTELASIINEIDSEDQRPIIITEGKTDKKILRTAWEKLYPTTSPPFKIISSGIDIDEEKRTGNAEAVRRTIEYLSTITDLTIIGLFDNDREGNEQFKGLNKSIFSRHECNVFHRKHNTKNVFGLILPPTPERSIFVTPEKITQRYFVIEHYFGNEVLEKFGLKGENILHTDVFEINPQNKNSFANQLENEDKEIFTGFTILFDKIKELIHI